VSHDVSRGRSGSGDPAASRRSDASPLNWLLVIPIVACLIVPVFNRQSPKLFDIPFFYWFQMAIIPVGVVCTVIAYRATRNTGRSDSRKDR
jgi:uncharacterized protein DUF3311